MRKASQNPLDAWRFLSNTWKRWYRLAERNLESLGLSLTEFRVLNRLQQDGPSPMARLARDQGLTRSSMTSVVDRLEAQGLVRRIRSREDRRVITIRISPRGRELRGKALTAHQAFVSHSLETLSSSEAASLVLLFQKIAQSLG
jgi:MarR family 2-MHQ and catechol resistance regulon transcriptional repressor